ncbi:hypothetical protein ABID42_003979 [Arcicella rosea]
MDKERGRKNTFLKVILKTKKRAFTYNLLPNTSKREDYRHFQVFF